MFGGTVEGWKVERWKGGRWKSERVEEWKGGKWNGGSVTYNGGLDPLVTNDFNFMLVISRPIRYRTDVTL